MRPTHHAIKSQANALAMKTLLLLRHAKSDWGDPDQDDFDRTLNARGRYAAPKIAHYMNAHGLGPDLVWCSTAQRARETWSLIAPALTCNDQDASVAFRDVLYLAPHERLLDLIRTGPDNTERLMIVAHNPGLHDLALLLAAAARDPADLRQLENGFPTATLAVFEIDSQQWSAIGSGVLERFVRPKQL